jgi:hypothetical protein
MIIFDLSTEFSWFHSGMLPGISVKLGLVQRAGLRMSVCPPYIIDFMAKPSIEYLPE